MDDAGTAGSTFRRGARRQITALLMDIVGYSTIASRADPEDLEEWRAAFNAQARNVIEAYDGVITEYLDDGVVALFGLDHPDELAASKAVNAAMAALQDIDASHDLATPIQLRIGVATSNAAVLTRDPNDNRPRATGKVTTLARRIQERAMPGQVMISETTQALLRGTVTTEKIGDEHLKGFAETQALFRPLAGQSPIPLDKTPFAGRTEILERIGANANAALVVGPTGIGKTALARHLAEKATVSTTFTTDNREIRISYLPFTQWILRVIGRKLPTYKDLCARFAALPDTTQKALALIMGLPEGQRLLAERSSLAVKALIEESLWMAIRATQAQGMLIFEDLHRFDHASLGVLAHIMKSKAASHYRILMTSCDDSKVDRVLDDLPVGVFSLGPLSDDEATDVCNALSRGKVSEDRRAKVIECARGVPLFIAQIFKPEAGNTPANENPPRSLKALLAEQINATGSAKPVLQCASVIGQRFDVEMLRAVIASHDPLEEHLDTACRHGVLQKEGKTVWAFAHELLQQETYESVPRQQRITYHSRIAAHLQKNHAAAILRDPAGLSEHLRRSQQYIPAIENLLSFGRKAAALGAFEDAEAHTLAALSLCEQAPDDAEIRALEIGCYAALGSVRMQFQSFAAVTVKDAIERVVRLAKDQSTYSAANGPAYYRCFGHALKTADKATATMFSDMLRKAAHTEPGAEPNSALRLASLSADTSLHFYAGNFEQASSAFRKLRARYDLSRHSGMVPDYGADPYATGQLLECTTRSICGDAHLVSGMVAEADAHLGQLDMPVLQPWAQIQGAVPLYYAGKTDMAVARLRRGLRAANTQSSAFWQMTGAAWLNVMDTSETYSEEGLANFHGVLKSHEKNGAKVSLPYFRAHYALALSRRDRIDEAYEASLRAIRESEASGLHCWHAEVLRLHAQTCDLIGGTRGATRFRKVAAAIATKQNALLWLLRVQLDQKRAGEISDAELSRTLGRFNPAAELPELRFAQHLLANR